MKVTKTVTTNVEVSLMSLVAEMVNRLVQDGDNVANVAISVSSPYYNATSVEATTVDRLNCTLKLKITKVIEEEIGVKPGKIIDSAERNISLKL
jgi:hypothetical protein